MLPQFLARHPLAPAAGGQGFLECMYELQEMLKEVTGMRGVALSPMAGAHGEFAGVAMIRAYHRSRGDLNAQRDHRAGGRPRHQSGDRDHVRLHRPGDPGRCAGRRGPRARSRRPWDPTPPASCSPIPPRSGCSSGTSREVARIVHEAGGLLYYDGANLNAILGKVRPGDMGFDVIHMNLHKTFSTPHGGGGPGAGAVGVGERLLPFLPIPLVGREGERYRWLDEADLPQSIGRLSAFMGNAGRAAARLHLHAPARARGHAPGGRVRHPQCQLPAQAPDRRPASMPPTRSAAPATSSSSRSSARRGTSNVTAMDFAKRLLDYGFHAPTTYFPLLVPECLLIEPTETESRQTLDAFVTAMSQIRKEAEQEPGRVTGAPHTMPVRRLDDVRAARQLDLTWKPTAPP